MLFYPSKQPDGYGAVYGDLYEFDGKLVFDEARFKKTDNGYQFFGNVTGVRGIQKKGEFDKAWEPALLQLEIHNRAYSYISKKGGVETKIDAQPSDTELFLCQRIESDPALFISDSHDLKGFIAFNALGIKSLLTGVNNAGNVLEPGTIAFLLANVCQFEKTEISKTTNIPKSGFGAGSGMRGELTPTRLEAKLEFVNRMLSPYTDGENKPKTLVTLALILKDVDADFPQISADIRSMILAVLSS